MLKDTLIFVTFIPELFICGIFFPLHKAVVVGGEMNLCCPMLHARAYMCQSQEVLHYMLKT
jgi:hypothetical protein